MKPATRLRQSIRAMAHATALLLLVCALVAPKVSLALVATFGAGNTSVLICSDGGLKRISIDANGQIVADEEANAWVSPHCALPDARTSDLARTWQYISYPPLKAVVMDRPESSLWLPMLARSHILSRGPPVL